MIKIKSSKKGGAFVGILMFFGSFALLWWNEGNAVAQFKTIGDLAKNTIEASADRVDSANEGKPVYLSAKADTTEELRDQTFDVGQVALRLRRKAEMYQWEEDEDKDSDSNTVTYSYDKVWSERHIDSNGFNDSSKRNPDAMPYQSKDWTAKDVQFGEAFKLPAFLVNDLSNFEKLHARSQLDIAGLKPHDGGYYLGADPSNPAIGDMRVSFATVLPGQASLIAEQAGSSFKRWQSPKTEREIHKIMPGTHSKAAIIERLETEARMLLWILRGVGFLLMFFGLLAITRPLSRLANFVPILGNIVESGITLVSLLLAGILSLLTIVIAWIVHRPVVGITLLLIAGSLAYLLFRALSSGNNEKRLARAESVPPPLPDDPTPPAT